MHNTAAYQIRKPSLPRRLRHTAVAAAIAAVAMVALPGLASAQQLNSVSIDTFRSSGTLVLDVNGASTTPGAPIIQWFRNGGSNQRWNVVDLGSIGPFCASPRASARMSERPTAHRPAATDVAPPPPRFL